MKLLHGIARPDGFGLRRILRVNSNKGENLQEAIDTHVKPTVEKKTSEFQKKAFGSCERWTPFSCVYMKQN